MSVGIILSKRLSIPQAGYGANSAKWSLAGLVSPFESALVLRQASLRAPAALSVKGPWRGWKGTEGQVQVNNGL
ncbi:hypothetical protein F5Y11DRAFT_327791 [Daldinia sp. FL1419]|nr:hypothetical protein F5Y11DRAFT_327791 [Daldinia sp. FL1419]